MTRYVLLKRGAKVKVTGEVSNGAWGTVYEGNWVRDGKISAGKVAVKVTRDPTKNFLNEWKAARIARKVLGNHAVRYIKANYSHKAIVMEYFPHGSLLKALKEGRMTEKLFKQLLKLILTLLQQKEFIHADVKPENILLNEDHWVYCDFGLSEKLDKRYETRYQDTGYFFWPRSMQLGSEALGLGADRCGSLGVLLQTIIFMSAKKDSVRSKYWSKVMTSIWKDGEKQLETVNGDNCRKILAECNLTEAGLKFATGVLNLLESYHANKSSQEISGESVIDLLKTYLEQDTVLVKAQSHS